MDAWHELLRTTYLRLNLWAIEEEWILDEDLREELSLLQCIDEE
jgi:hypothetical protein